MNRYFDNASTSFPKSKAMSKAFGIFVDKIGGTYGRGFSRRIARSSAMVEDVRDALGRRLNLDNGQSLAFTSGTTESINLILNSVLSEKSDVWISPLEHNAVIRPLRYLKHIRSLRVRILPSLADGYLDLERIASLDFSKTSLVIVNAQSNVNGVVQPIDLLRLAIPHAPILIDAAQAMGAVPIHPLDMGLDYVAFSAHKYLFGPSGVGALYGKNLEGLVPFRMGGTGSRSSSFEMPKHMPDHLEAGTPNTMGIITLGAALRKPVLPKHTHDDFLTWLRDLRQIQSLRVIAAENESHQGETISILHDALSPDQLARHLYERNRIETRVGLHCAPLAHWTLGTYPHGTVRISLSPAHTTKDLRYLAGRLSEVPA